MRSKSEIGILNGERYIQHLSYQTANHHPIFNDLSLSFSQEKTAIVGRNGIGKSTLLKLIAGDLHSSVGNIQRNSSISHCPQNFTAYLSQTITDVLNVREKLNALKNIENGSVDLIDYKIIGDDWDIKERIKMTLNDFGFKDLNHDRLLSDMSGGEITRLFLAKTFFKNPDFILLDEPTNHLDFDSLNALESELNRYQGALLIISHDRIFLEKIKITRYLFSKSQNMFTDDFK